MTEFKNPFENKNSSSTSTAFHPRSALAGGFIEGLIQDFGQIIFKPRVFFGSINENFSTGKALAYGVLCHWFGAAGQLLFSNLGVGSTRTLDQFLEKSFHTKASEWAMVRVAADPLLSIVQIASLAITVYFAGKMLIPHKTIRMKDAMRITAISMVSGAFAFLPWIGEAVSGVLGFFLLAFGIQGFYKISFMRSLVVIVLPQIIATSLIFIAVLLGAGVALMSLV